MTPRFITVALATAVLAACSGEAPDEGTWTLSSEPPLAESSPDAQAAPNAQFEDLHVWSYDPVLREHATAAAARIRNATGVVVAVSAGPLVDAALELRWTAEGLGHWSAYCLAGERGALLLGIDVVEDERVGILVHEMLHALGVSDHTPEGLGLMSAPGDPHSPLTSSDLELLCAQQECLWFTPEKNAPSGA